MDAAEFEKRLNKLPVEEPDEIDKAMLAGAGAVNDGTTVSLDDLEEYSGKLVLRIPRSLHKSLKEAAAEGVSLNQYMLYKLAR